MSNDTAQKRIDIGGQAVMEGVMMKGPEAVAVAVRRPNGTIVVKRDAYIPPSKKHKWMGYPFFRGIIGMGSMLSLGMKTLQLSSNMLGLMDEEPSKFEKWLSKKLGKGIDKIVMGTAAVLAIVLAIGLFFVLPALVGSALRQAFESKVVVNLLEGLTRILILIGYMIFCGSIPDVRRTFQYHGAEHKTVYCHEHDLPLTPENARQFSPLHPRCGTTFLLIVFVLAILLYTLVGYNGSNYILRVLSRLALLPIVAGISYEILKGLAHADGKLVRALRWPGLMMQKLTTRTPDDKMLEVAIAAMNAALYGLPEGEKTQDGYTVVNAAPKTEPVQA
jgi:uncharacterized protein YqhQ